MVGIWDRDEIEKGCERYFSIFSTKDIYLIFFHFSPFTSSYLFFRELHNFYLCLTIENEIGVENNELIQRTCTSNMNKERKRRKVEGWECNKINIP